MTLPNNTKPSLDPIAFRNALGTFVTGVTIVTTLDAEQRPVGLTANSFNSVSLEPPMVLWSLGLNAASLPTFRNAKYWAVHVLGSDQEALSNRFAKRGINKFESLETEAGPGDIPLLKGCAARFVCRAAFEYEGGDHAIFVGEVESFERQTTVPLAFHEGRYARVLAPAPPPAEDVPFGRQFIGHSLGRAHYDLLKDIRREYRKRGLRGRDYTVLTVLGIGDDCTLEDILRRSASGGVDVGPDVVAHLLDIGLLVLNDGRYALSANGQQTVIELIAVAQASQERLESLLAPGEVATLKHLLARVIEAAPAQ
jgi:3-hydroxy-9,10-secoandrosta-1,3,5(10)-triene-9,17-dione monooxygenase reductase component